MKRYTLFCCTIILALVGVSVGQVGGWEDASVEDNDVMNAAKFATKELNSQSDALHHHKLVKIHKAQTQVVSGTNYQVHIEIAPTTCKKSEVSFEDAEKCSVLIDGVNRLCRVVVWVQPWTSSTKLTEHVCEDIQ
ncbi:L-cystatin-like [Limulus polyphemus]|uniref:L-cystatin-like n=1 Tax=Limulus polyphemus TaxID=6850 RepID=A0ABM1B8M8_LIMPO|nr:L-cystatin-like [Limulus polyphemus]